MIDPKILQEAAQKTQESVNEAKALTAKLKGINGYLTSLLQKKVRIDIEIRRTKARLTKLKNKSSTLVKTRVQLESAYGLSAVSALYGTELKPDTPAAAISDLTAALNETESLLTEIEQLPLVEDL